MSAAPNDVGRNRFGFITGKKIGNAIKRNRARRLMREAVRLRLPNIKQGWDLVWVARTPIAEADFEAVGRAVDEALTRSRLRISGGAETGGAQSRIIDIGEGKAKGPSVARSPNIGEPAPTPEKE